MQKILNYVLSETLFYECSIPCNNDQNIVERYMDGDSSIFVESDFFLSI